MVDADDRRGAVAAAQAAAAIFVRRGASHACMHCAPSHRLLTLCARPRPCDPQKEDDIFSLQGPEWAPSASTGEVRLLEAAQGAVFVSTAKGQLLRLNTAGGDYEELELPRGTGNALQSVFVDPYTAHALILATAGGDNFYVFRSKCRPLTKMKGVQIASVAWLPPRSDPPRADAREVLIGTMGGVLCEAVIEPTRTRHFKQCYTLSPPRPVLGLQLEPFPSAPPLQPAHAGGATGGGMAAATAAAAEERKLYVMAVTATRCYEFVGGPNLDALFSEHRDIAPPSREVNPSAAQLAAEAPRTCLAFYRLPNRAASAFGWLTAAGIYHGTLVFGSQSAGDSVVLEHGLLPYPVQDPAPHEGAAAADAAAVVAAAPAEAPLALELSEFHLLLLYPSSVLALSRLNHQVACRVSAPHGWPAAPLGGLAHDGARGTLWVWGARGVLRLLVRREDRHVWRLHLEAGDYEAALSYCSDLSQRDRVLTAQADHEFERGAYELAALKYAKTRRSFEEVALRFMRAAQRGALQTFLLHKLDAIDERDTPQLTMICTWLTEMYLHAIDAARGGSGGGGGGGGGGGSGRRGSDGGGAGSTGVAVDEAALALEFRCFLTDKQRHLSRGTTFALISAHGQLDQLLHYATLCGDWERVLSHHVQQRDAPAALEVLTSLVRAASGGGPDYEGAAMEVERLLEMFSPELIELAPSHTVDVWIAAEFVDPLKALPALMRYDESRSSSAVAAAPPPPASPGAGASASSGRTRGREAHQGLRYLHHCVGELGCQQAVLHNYLVLLHARLSDEPTLLSCLRGTLDAPPLPPSGVPLSPASGGDAAAHAAHAASELVGSLRSTQISEAHSLYSELGGAAGGLAGAEPAYDVYYDAHYALRVCTERGRHEACVLLHQRLGLHAEAVTLSLAHGKLRLAKQSADLPRGDEARRNLWLQVARHVIAQADQTQQQPTATGDGGGGGGGAAAAAAVGAKAASAELSAAADQAASVRAAVALLHECELLRIDDLLAYLPDFARIDEFKEQICASLEDYNRQIDELKAEMGEATASADALRKDIKQLRERRLAVPVGRACDCPELAPTFAPTCGGGCVGAHAFVAFPCSHAFRLRCLEHALPPHERQRLAQPGHGALEEALAAECPLCGEAMVQSVGKPFVDLEAEAAVVSSWAVA